MHIKLKEPLSAIYSLTVVARQCTSPVTFSLKTVRISRKQGIKEGKAKRTSATGSGPIGKGGHSVAAEYVPGLFNRAEEPSRTLTTRDDWTIRGEVLEEVWHRMGLRPTIDASQTTTIITSPSIGPTSTRLTRLEQTQWRRSGTVVALSGMDEAGSTLHHIGKHLPRSIRQLEPAPRWLTQVFLLYGAQVGGTQKNRKLICIRAPRRTSHPTSGNGWIRSLWQHMENAQVSRKIRLYL